ncbi:hypothetical protein ACFY9N_11580 [Microbacterium sp. NPDC008134]|uniref:hypothetical protein n=1 Tax=Microbacterium sp. NPDC008134 TaxID=3364183 RepID=UPI0036E72DC6
MCQGWGFYSVSKDPDEERDCLDCGGTGVRAAPTAFQDLGGGTYRVTGARRSALSGRYLTSKTEEQEQ